MRTLESVLKAQLSQFVYLASFKDFFISATGSSSTTKNKEVEG